LNFGSGTPFNLSRRYRENFWIFRGDRKTAAEHLHTQVFAKLAVIPAQECLPCCALGQPIKYSPHRRKPQAAG